MTKVMFPVLFFSCLSPFLLLTITFYSSSVRLTLGGRTQFSSVQVLLNII